MLLCSKGASKMFPLIFYSKLETTNRKTDNNRFLSPFRGDMLIENKDGIATKAP
jgi:hypothetical protein